MRFGVIGLGRMGASMAKHGVEKGHSIVGFDESAEVRAEVAATHIQCAGSIEELVDALAFPRVIILLVPHGGPTHMCCDLLCSLLSPGDLVCDNGNSHWEDSKRHAADFAVAGICFLDIGTSGGVSAARHGACFMVGGERQDFERVEPILRDLAVDDDAVYYVGPVGSGQFVELIRNAIEFGMVQSIAEGIEMLMRSEYDLDLPSLLNNWTHGSVVRS